MIHVRLEQNKVILEFDNEEEARLFYNFLRQFKQIETDIRNSTLQIPIKTDEKEIQKYRTYLTKKNKPVKDQDTIQRYITILKKFAKCSNNKITPESLLACVKNKHYERAIRNYIHMKYYYKEISRNQYLELLERVPRFREEQTLAQDRVPVSSVLISLARAKRTKYQAIYYALYYSGGTRLEQLIESIRNKPTRIDNFVKIPIKSKGTKKAAFLYLPIKIYHEVLNINVKAKPKTITKIFRQLKLIPITLVRSFCWQTAKQILNEELALLLQGRIGELKKRVTARSYDDLFFQLDMIYPKWKLFVDELIANATENKNLAKNRAKKLIDKYNLLMPI